MKLLDWTKTRLKRISTILITTWGVSVPHHWLLGLDLNRIPDVSWVYLAAVVLFDLPAAIRDWRAND
ncbi:MAG: hypothetical protein N4A53_08230 [Pelagimonas sp.]|nr:hypothetical protein [Pelagimonas sp.]